MTGTHLIHVEHFAYPRILPTTSAAIASQPQVERMTQVKRMIISKTYDKLQPTRCVTTSCQIVLSLTAMVLAIYKEPIT